MAVPRLLVREGDHQGHALSVQPFVAGQQLGQLWQRGDEAAWRAAGEALGGALARLHARTWPGAGWLALDEAGGLRVEPWDHLRGEEADPLLAYVGQALRGRAGERLGREWRERCLAQLERHRGLAQAEASRLIHGDLNPTNVLVGSAGELRALLDWEWCHAGTPLSDLGNLCRRRPGGGPPEPFVATLAQGYRAEGGHLDERWRLGARLVDLSSQVEFLGREDDALARELGAGEILRATVVALEAASAM